MAMAAAMSSAMRQRRSSTPHHEIRLIGEVRAQAGIQPGLRAGFPHLEVILQRVGRIGVCGRDAGAPRVAALLHFDELEPLGLIDVAIIHPHRRYRAAWYRDLERQGFLRAERLWRPMGTRRLVALGRLRSEEHTSE